MARIRTIKPELFKHTRLFDAEKASGLPLRIAFAGLFTAADREGRFNWEPRALKLDCLPYDDCDFEQVLNALNAHGFIQKYEIDGRQYGCIPSWKQHQHINVREAQSTIPEPTDASMCTHVIARGEGKGRERKGREGKGREGVSTRKNASVTDEDFDKFKKAYPKRKGSNPWTPARLLFERAVRAGAVAENICRAAKGYGLECDELKITSTDKVAQAQTWLRQERYRDYEEILSNPRPYREFIRDDTPEGKAWTAHDIATKGRKGPRSNEGWWRESRWPPGHKQAEAA